MLTIVVTLIFSVTMTIIIVACICYKKHKLNRNNNDDDDGDSEESNIHSDSLISDRHNRQLSHIQGFRSPPPPYTTCERPERVFMTASVPPPYESPVNGNLPTNPQPPPSTLEIASTITNPSSLQTFQA